MLSLVLVINFSNALMKFQLEELWLHAETLCNAVQSTWPSILSQEVYNL